MMRKFRFLLLFLVFVGGFAFSPTVSPHAQSGASGIQGSPIVLLGPPRGPENPYRERSPETDRRNAAIEEELKELKNHPWAGEYVFGRGIGTRRFLRLAPQAGYTFFSGGCVIDSYYLNYGSVEWSGGKILLHPSTQPLGDESSFERFRVFYPVKWGERRYLIGEDEVFDFINEINQGHEPCEEMFCTRFFLRADDKKKKTSGNPDLPAQFQGYLLKKPIRATIIAIGKSQITEDKDFSDLRYRDTEITLNVGSAQGVWEEMEFLRSGQGSSVSAVVTKVELNSCTAIITDRIFKDEKPPPPPTLGWKFSTSRKD